MELPKSFLNMKHEETAEAVVAGLNAIESFRDMSESEFLALPAVERGFIGGAILGNYSSHHPKEAFKILRSICGPRAKS